MLFEVVFTFVTFQDVLKTIPVAAAEPCGGLQNVYLCNPSSPFLFDICIGDQKYTMSCPGGLHFNSKTQICDWPQNADCGKPQAEKPIPEDKDEMARYREPQTNYFSPPEGGDRTENNGWSSNTDYSDLDAPAATGQTVTVRHLGPEQLQERGLRYNDQPQDRSAPAQSSQERAGPVHTSNHNSGSVQGYDDPLGYDSNSRGPVSRSPGGTSRGRFRMRESGGRSADSQDQSGLRNPYLSKGQRHREMMLRQKEQRERAYRQSQNRMADDGYNRHSRKTLSRGGLKALPQQQNQQQQQQQQQKNQNQNQRNEQQQQQQQHEDGEDDNSIIIYGSADHDHGSSRTETVKDNTSERQQKSNINDNNNVGGMNGNNNNNNNNNNFDRDYSMNQYNSNNGNSHNNQNVDNNHVNKAHDGAPPTSQDSRSDRFKLANYPWWTSKSSPSASSSSSSHQIPAHDTHRNHRSRANQSPGQVSRTTRRQEQGLAPFYQPAAAPRYSDSASASAAAAAAAAAASRNSNVPPQQAMAAKPITAAAASSGPKRKEKPPVTDRRALKAIEEKIA